MQRILRSSLLVAAVLVASATSIGSDSDALLTIADAETKSITAENPLNADQAAHADQ